MLTIYRRHRPNCPARDRDRLWQKCKCHIWASGSLGRDYVREALGTNNWEYAQTIVRQRETDFLFGKPEEAPAVTIEAAIESFLKDSEHGGKLSAATLSKLRVLLKSQLLPFAKAKGLERLEQFDTEALREFRAGWKDAPILR